MDINNEELQEDLNEQYAILEEEVQEDKKKRRVFFLFIFFLFLFLMMFGATFSYIRVYNSKVNQEVEEGLKDLYVEGYKDSFEFNPNIHRYVLTVPGNTKMLDVRYVLGSINYDVEITGNDDLVPGTNEIKVIVKDEDGKEEIYIIYVVVEEEEDPTNPPNGNNNNNNNSNNNNSGEDNKPNIPNNGDNGNNNGGTEVDKINKDLIYLDVTNHKLNPKFESNKTSYIVNDIKSNEDQISINFKLADNNNKVIIKLNDEEITREVLVNSDMKTITLNVKTELLIGTNHVQIIVRDKNGEEKVYHVFLVVTDEEIDKVVEITVEYGNGNGTYTFNDVVPGWQSPNNQYIKVVNKSNYNTSIDIDWVDVENTFENKNDLVYTLYKDSQFIKKDVLPSTNEKLISGLEVKANSINNYYINYKYIYRETDQNVDQGKSYSSSLKISLTQN